MELSKQQLRREREKWLPLLIKGFPFPFWDGPDMDKRNIINTVLINIMPA